MPFSTDIGYISGTGPWNLVKSALYIVACSFDLETIMEGGIRRRDDGTEVFTGEGDARPVDDHGAKRIKSSHRRSSHIYHQWPLPRRGSNQ